MGTHPIFESDFDCLTVKIGENVQTWTRWSKWWEIPHLNGPPSCCSYELRRQHWRQVPLRHCRYRHQRTLEQTSSSRIRRFGHGLREEGQARVAQKGPPCRRCASIQGLPTQGRNFPLLRGQRRRHRQQQGRDEGLCRHWTRRQGVCRSLAPYLVKLWLNLLIHCY